MYLDEDVERGEAHQLFLRSLRAIRRTVTGRGVVGLVTNAGLAKLYRRRSIRRQLYEGADRAIRIAQGRGGVLITRPESEEAEWYRPVPPHQRTLDDFAYEEPRITALGLGGGFREVRVADHLQLAW